MGVLLELMFAGMTCRFCLTRNSVCGTEFLVLDHPEERFRRHLGSGAFLAYRHVWLSCVD